MEKTYVVEMKISVDEEVLKRSDSIETIVLDSLEEASYQVDSLNIEEV